MILGNLQENFNQIGLVWNDIEWKVGGIDLQPFL